MVFAFVSCDDSNKAPEESTYSNEEIVIDYINSISFEKVKKDVIAAAKGEESPISIEFDLEKIEIGKSEAIPFKISIKEGSEYSTGFHDGIERTVKSGQANIVVNGHFVEGAENATFKATSYTIVSTADGVIVDEKFGEHKLSGEIKGPIDATITLEDRNEQGMSFSLSDGFKYGLPKPGENVLINVDGKKVDYQEVYDACKDTTGNMLIEK